MILNQMLNVTDAGVASSSLTFIWPPRNWKDLDHLGISTKDLWIQEPTTNGPRAQRFG
jgi:hypothetical protein